MSTTQNDKGLIAAIDVGTNSFHMVIASVNHRGLLQIHAREKEVVRLGDSATDMKFLSDEAIERGVATLSRFAEIAHHHEASIRAIATSAVREALNKDEFVQRVLVTSGIHVDVIPGVEEGRLIYAGAIHALPIRAKRAFVIDIGGGSTETIVGVGGKTLAIDSAKLGHLRLTTRYFRGGRVSAENVRLCRDAIRGEWSTVLQEHRKLGIDVAVGCSGTIQMIAAMVAARRGRIPENMNGYVVTRDEILETVEIILQASTPAKRAALAGMDPKRSDVIPAGALILERAVLAMKLPSITVSTYALREGIVFDTAQQRKDIQQRHHLTPLRYQSVQNVCDVYRVRKRHAKHVKNLSVRLFDALRPLHLMGDIERELLEAAALLHDVGYHISADQHHKHSEYIIRNCAMPGFTGSETDIIACIARYHRKSHPKKKHPLFAALSLEDQYRVRLLSSLLRVAEGLDRRLHSVVRDLIVTIQPTHIDIELIATSSTPDIELWGGNRRKGLLEEVVGRSVCLSHKEM